MVVTFLVCGLVVLGNQHLVLDAGNFAQQDLSYHVFLPLLTRTGPGCERIAGETYATLVPVSPPTDRPAEQHADLNLALRGYSETRGLLGLVDYGGISDGKSPKLATSFTDNRVPAFVRVSQVYGWNWDANRRAGLITEPAVTLVGMGVTMNEIMHVPKSEYNIGTRWMRPPHGFFDDAPDDDGSRYEVLVLYASRERITLKYTREDNVVNGFTIHVENVCVAPDLLELYQTWNESGRGQLPALKQGQGFARALGSEIGVAIRDNGSFMDPRSRKDWW